MVEYFPATQSSAAALPAQNYPALQGPYLLDASRVGGLGSNALDTLK